MTKKREEGGFGKKKKHREQKRQWKRARDGKIKKQNKAKEEKTWHLSHTLSCRQADIIIVKLGGRFRLSCRCGGLITFRGPVPLFINIPLHPSLATLSPVRRHHQRVVGMSVCVFWDKLLKEVCIGTSLRNKEYKNGYVCVYEKVKEKPEVSTDVMDLPQTFQPVGVPQGSRSGPLHFLPYRAFSLFWCPLQSLYQAWPPSCPLGLHLGLMDPAAAESLDLREQSAKPQTCSCVSAGKGSCASHGVCFTGESHALAN